MLSDFDAAIKAKYLEYLTQELLFIARHPCNARRGHRAATELIENLRRFELIDSAQAESLLDDADEALLAAIRTREARR